MSKINIVENQIRLGECITTYLNVRFREDLFFFIILLNNFNFYLSVQVIKEILTKLWNLIEEFKSRHELEKNKIFNEYFSDLVKSIQLKLNVLRLQALTNVYDKKIVESLNVIRANLIERENEKSTKLKELNNQLMEYQNVGDDFEQIVQIYLDIIKDIETTQDDIRRIRQT